MPSFNKAILAGNLTRDPELRQTPKGTAICQFGIAINRHWTTEGGERRDEVTFLDCEAFGRQAEVLGQHLRKGAAVLVEGRIAREEWDDKATGQKRSATRIIVKAFQFLGSRSRANAWSRTLPPPLPMKIPPPPPTPATTCPSEPWIRIRLKGLTQLVNAPPPRRWRWTTERQARARRMVLVSPRGQRWAFRLNRGAWLQRIAANAASPAPVGSGTK